MKKIIYFALLLSVFTSCLKNENPIDEGAKAGGRIQAVTNLLSYYFGTATVPINGKLKIFQAEEQIVKINVYKQFFSNDTSLTGDPTGVEVVASNKNLLKTIDVASTSTSFQDFSFLYADLIQGLSINGTSMPTIDTSLVIGSYWELTFEAVMSDGRIVNNSAKMKVGISTRFAGTYKIVFGEYYRINVSRPDVAYPETYSIQSINKTTYKILDFAGPFEGQETLFTIDADGNITYPAGQVINGFAITTCQSAPQYLTNVRCGSSNYAVADFVTGKDRLYLTYGYYTDNGAVGPREFYIELEKIP